MKSKLVKSCLALFLGCVFCSMGLNNIGAASMDQNARSGAYQYFGGEAGYNYAQLTPASGNYKQDNNDTAGVRWTSSNKDNHKMWFMVTNGVGTNRGKKLFNFLSQGPISTSGTAANYPYYLHGAREHIGNPAAYVAGTWAP